MSGVRLIATDLDGTLLDPSGHIVASDVEAVRAAADAGVVVVVATGRPLRWLDCLEPIADAHPLVVPSNGAMVYDLLERRVVKRHPLGRELVEELAADLRAGVPGLMFALEEGDVFRCEPAWSGHVPDRSRTDAQEAAITFRDEWADLLAGSGHVVKFLAAHPDADPDDLVHRAARVIGDRAEVTHSVAEGRRALLEISAAGVSKAATLAELCAERDIAPSDVAAFGDMPNDLAMLEFAGHPFVMANGHPTLRDRFPVIGSNDSGGVGERIRLLLG